ncbi:MAG: RHS repeat-associated core domain-containing protein [Acidobacteria bacterium]|nr:MAG: RHS repeat-associated core domain-containing protein [Acidobacteriota bacterium]
MVKQVGHGNGVTDTYGKDPNDMGRPYRIQSAGALSNWDSGSFEYDGAGNIKALRGMLEPVARPAPTRQQYTYDAFGNLKRIDLNGVTYQDLATSTSTNRLNAAGFDASGNMTTWGGYTYDYDPLNAMATLQGTGIKRQHLYDAEGERGAVRDVNNPTTPVTTLSLRGLDGKVLREYVLTGAAWSWGKDYVYRNGQLLAAIDATGTKHMTLDHLGSPRLITDAGRNVVEYHAYWGYGQEIDTAVGTERMKFTGHERDNLGSAGALDYMHARYYNPTIGRFLAVDQGNGKPDAPGSWNRYGYTTGNPIKYADPGGNNPFPLLFDPQQLMAGVLALSEAAQGASWKGIGPVAKPGWLVGSKGYGFKGLDWISIDMTEMKESRVTFALDVNGVGASGTWASTGAGVKNTELFVQAVGFNLDVKGLFSLDLSSVGKNNKFEAGAGSIFGARVTVPNLNHYLTNFFDYQLNWSIVELLERLNAKLARQTESEPTTEKRGP